MSDLVTVKIAEKLKEKGFPQHICDTGYIIENDEKNRYNTGDKEVVWKIPKDYMYIAAPTIAQALKWLRKEHKLHICIDLDVNKNWFYSIEGIINNTNITDTSDYSSYEEAAISGIGYVLDTLIK